MAWRLWEAVLPVVVLLHVWWALWRALQALPGLLARWTLLEASCAAGMGAGMGRMVRPGSDYSRTHRSNVDCDVVPQVMCSAAVGLMLCKYCLPGQQVLLLPPSRETQHDAPHSSHSPHQPGSAAAAICKMLDSSQQPAASSPPGCGDGSIRSCPGPCLPGLPGTCCPSGLGRKSPGGPDSMRCMPGPCWPCCMCCGPPLPIMPGGAKPLPALGLCPCCQPGEPGSGPAAWPGPLLPAGGPWPGWPGWPGPYLPQLLA